MVTLRMAIRLLSVISVIILARILTPEDYGIVAQAAMVYSLLDVFTQFGLDNALISNKQAARSHYDTVWTISILRGVLTALLLVLLAAPSAVFFRQPDLELIIYAYAAISFATGFINVGVVDFRKDLQFHLDFRFVVFQKVAGFIATLAFAYNYQSYWAFIFGSAFSTLVALGASFAMSAFRPRLTLSEWEPLFHFSKWVLPQQIVGAVSQQAETFILSRFSSPALLGLFTVSNEISATTSSEIAMPVGRAMMPGLSTVNDDPAAFRALYSSALCLVLMIAIPAALGMNVLAKPMTALLLGDKWLDAAGVISILSLCAIARVISALSASGFFANRRVDIMFKFSVVTLVVRLVLLGVGYQLQGFEGLLWAVLISSSIIAAMSLVLQIRLGMLSAKEIFAGSWRVLSSGTCMWLVLSQLSLESGLGVALDLACSVAIGAIIYGTSLFSLWALQGRPNGPEAEIVDFIHRKFLSRLQTFNT